MSRPPNLQPRVGCHTAGQEGEGRATRVDSRVQRGDETKAHSLPGPVVLVLEATQHSVPHVLQGTHTLRFSSRTFLIQALYFPDYKGHLKAVHFTNNKQCALKSEAPYS